MQFRCAARGARRGHAAHALHRRGHDGAELLEIDGLGEVVERAGAQGLDGVFGRSVSGHDHAALAPLLRTHLLQQLHAEAVGQAHVGDDGVELLPVQLRARLLHTGGGFHAVAFAQQGQLVERAQVGFVIDDEDGGGAGHTEWIKPRGCRTARPQQRAGPWGGKVP
jgi:hypothetical protein